MHFFIFFIVTGVIMYLFDFLLIRLWKQLNLLMYLFTGAVVGIAFGWIIKSIYNFGGYGWTIIPMVAISASIFHFIFSHFELYRKGFVRLFGTILLGICTGILSWAILEISMALFPSQIWFGYPPKALWLDMIIYSFLLHFGYAFIGRFFQRRFPDTKKESS